MTSLHLMQASMETFDTVEEFAMDVGRILSRGALAIGWTEVGKATHREALETLCQDWDYHLTGGNGDTAVAVSKTARPLAAGTIPVHAPGQGYGARFLDWATFTYRQETIHVAEAHWVRPGTADRMDDRAAMTRASLAFLAERGQGTDLAFMMGDTNTDDSRGNTGAMWSAYVAADVTTLYDELNVYPATGPGGGSIDMIASRDADTRVKATGYRVWKMLHSDHRQVSGYYIVRPR